MSRLLLVLLLALPLTALARDWQVDPAGSTLGFRGTYQGEAFEGHFKAFDASISYDPANLASANVVVTVDLASADTGSSERDETLQGSDFFATAKFPQARFTTTTFSGEGAAVQAQGNLTLRDTTRPVVLTVRFTPQGADAATLDVDTTLERKDFGLGTSADWADIGNDVPVHAHLVLKAK
jgi:polyisoprenoid-binding protein YceI